MQAVLGHWETLRFQGIVKFLDAEGSGGIAQQVALEPSQGNWIRNPMPLDNIPQHSHIHIPLQKRTPIADIEILRIGKPTFLKVCE